MVEAVLTGLRAAAEPTRLRVLAILSKGELAVSELTQILGQSQPRVSRHLRLLCEAGLLDRFPEGAWVFYRLASSGLGADLVKCLLDLLPDRDPSLSLDMQRLDAVRAGRADKAQKYFSAHAERWDELNTSLVDRDGVENAMRAAVTDFHAADLVDMGTGTGHALTVLSDCVGQATGFDMSLDMLAVARANLEQAGHRHCMVRQGDITQLPLGDGVTDCAVIHQVLHYMPDPALVVGEAARILKPGGHVLAVDYAPHGEEWLRDQHAHRRLGFQDEEVHRWFDAHGLIWQGARRIKGPKLDVVLWTAQKPVTH